MERYCSTDQSPQRAVAPTEEEEASGSAALNPVKEPPGTTEWRSSTSGLKCWRRDNLLHQPETEHEIQMGYVVATYCGMAFI